MEINRVNCFTATCEKCEHHVFVRRNFWNVKLYTCPYLPKQHKAIDGRDCGNFRCIEDYNWLMCEECSRGEPVAKVLKI